MNSYLIIPVLNEEKSISKVLENIETQDFSQIIVVDNGSTDKTREVALSFGAVVVLENQKGYGKACLKGISYLGDKLDLDDKDIVCFIDGDFSDDPKELRLLISEIKSGNDLVIGSRMRGDMQEGAMAIHARFGNWLATSILGFLYTHYKFSDLGPMRAVRWGVLKSFEMCDENFGWTIEMQMKALQLKVRCQEIPVSYKQRVGVSKISGSIKGSIQAGFKILYSILKYR